MSKKSLDLTGLQNELEGSAFFQPPPAAPDAATPPPEVAHIEAKPRKHVSMETRKHVSTDLPPDAEPTTESGSGLGDLFSLDVPVNAKKTYDFTAKELDYIDDVKRELRRKYDLKITQYNIVRCALGELLEDFKQNGSNSTLVRRLKKRSS
jgi:hypothetical protein